MRRLLALSLVLAACAEPAALDDSQATAVEDRDARLTAMQRFEDDGELRETVLRLERDSETTELRARGALLTHEGPTSAGLAVRTWLAGQRPRLLARFMLAEPRFDLAVLTADALLGLDSQSQARASRVFEANGARPAPLCAHLSACVAEGAPQT